MNLILHAITEDNIFFFISEFTIQKNPTIMIRFFRILTLHTQDLTKKYQKHNLDILMPSVNRKREN